MEHTNALFLESIGARAGDGLKFVPAGDRFYFDWTERLALGIASRQRARARRAESDATGPVNVDQLKSRTVVAQSGATRSVQTSALRPMASSIQELEFRCGDIVAAMTFRDGEEFVESIGGVENQPA